MCNFALLLLVAVCSVTLSYSLQAYSGFFPSSSCLPPSPPHSPPSPFSPPRFLFRYPTSETSSVGFRAPFPPPPLFALVSPLSHLKDDQEDKRRHLPSSSASSSYFSSLLSSRRPRSESFLLNDRVSSDTVGSGRGRQIKNRSHSSQQPLSKMLFVSPSPSSSPTPPPSSPSNEIKSSRPSSSIETNHLPFPPSPPATSSEFLSLSSATPNSSSSDSDSSAALCPSPPSPSSSSPSSSAEKMQPEKKKKKKILVLGGDGFCGWPSSLYLSACNHEVVIVDNLSRRRIDDELGTASLTPLQSIETRIKTWREKTGREIRFVQMDICRDYPQFLNLLKSENPDTIVHFAEQRAAPYSMKGSAQKRYTVDNNIVGTHNVLCGIVESGLDVHVVHLGTMGVYGYGTTTDEIPEGYLDVLLPDGKNRRILHPAYPGSVYHTTKCMDALLFQFYNKNDNVRVTDLHQGVVWGTNTEETLKDEKLINRFDYDSDYGTVLNRFLMQSALGIPLTVYGTGGQTRAFIHISDTCKCVELAVSNPPELGQPVEILNQVAETLRIRDLAELISNKTGTKVTHLSNPRVEATENELKVSNRKFRKLGWKPTFLNERLFAEVREIAVRYRSRCNLHKVMPSSFWNRQRKKDYDALRMKTTTAITPSHTSGQKTI